MSSAYSEINRSNYKQVKIAIVGTEGAGKTVLMCVLARRLCVPTAEGVFLEPCDAKTLRYVERVWATLQAGDWPPSTPPGEVFELTWNLHVGTQKCELRVADVAGQDIRRLFSDDQFQALQSAPEAIQEVAKYCREADVVLFLVNLRDFIGEGDANRRAENEAALKTALDYVTTSRRRACLVVAQADLFVPLQQKLGGWLNLYKKSMPYLYSAYIAPRRVSVYPVAAVLDTQTIVDPDGKPRRIPRSNFRSAGLPNIQAWIIRAVNGTASQKSSSRVQSVCVDASAQLSHHREIPVMALDDAVAIGTGCAALALAILLGFWLPVVWQHYNESGIQPSPSGFELLLVGIAGGLIGLLVGVIGGAIGAVAGGMFTGAICSATAFTMGCVLILFASSLVFPDQSDFDLGAFMFLMIGTALWAIAGGIGGAVRRASELE